MCGLPSSRSERPTRCCAWRRCPDIETIAERLGITIVGRHTALGDAIATGEIFLKLLTAVSSLGIHTLGQAREASQKTYYARIAY
jgi:DNA polymerase-3 subunit epsilon